MSRCYVEVVVSRCCVEVCVETHIKGPLRQSREDGHRERSVEDVSRCRGCVEAMRRAMCVEPCVEPDVEDVELEATRAQLTLRPGRLTFNNSTVKCNMCKPPNPKRIRITNRNLEIIIKPARSKGHHPPCTKHCTVYQLRSILLTTCIVE